MTLYRLYKFLLVLAVIIITALFLLLPRVSAKADVEVAPKATVVLSNEGQIRRFAAMYGVDAELAVAIAKCESRLYARAKNPSSTAKGLFQFIDSSWGGYAKRHWGEIGNVYDAEDNADLGVWVLAKFGTGDWDASKWCWMKETPASVTRT